MRVAVAGPAGSQTTGRLIYASLDFAHQERNAMPQVTRLRVVCAAAATGALALGGLTTATVTATAAQAASPRSAISATHPPWAVPSKRVNVTAASDGAVTARVYLASRNQAALASYANAVSTPGQ